MQQLFYFLNQQPGDPFYGEEEKAFAHDYPHHFKKMYAKAFRLVRDKHDAKDIASMALMKLWDQRKAFSEQEQAAHFLHIAVQRMCFDLLKYVRHQQVHLSTYSHQLEPYEELSLDCLDRHLFETEV